MQGFLDYQNVDRDDVISQYILAGYFINTIFTTVGFGDVYGRNTAERCFIILVEWTGAISFATVVSEIQDMVHKSNRRNNVEWAICFATVVSEIQDMVHKFNRRAHGRKERMQYVRGFLSMQYVRGFLASYHCSDALRREILEWVHFSFMVQHDKADQMGVLESLPLDLQERLALHLNKGMIGEIPLLANIKAQGRFRSPEGDSIIPKDS
ncbi:hypothetical protein T484DRAFT_1810330 [Baffinella frigidus]|nr:hypothetical protein T484DRAFT_1810330 [Cryptophyta sp. CCMP2293]